MRELAYEPDRWVVIKGLLDGEEVTRIVAGWSGGYLDGDYWRISSVISVTQELDDRYEFDNESGSRYICYKRRWGFNGITANVFKQLQERQPDSQWEIIESYRHNGVTQALIDAQVEMMGE